MDEVQLAAIEGRIRRYVDDEAMSNAEWCALVARLVAECGVLVKEVRRLREELSRRPAGGEGGQH